LDRRRKLLLFAGGSRGLPAGLSNSGGRRRRNAGVRRFLRGGKGMALGGLPRFGRIGARQRSRRRVSEPAGISLRGNALLLPARTRAGLGTISILLEHHDCGGDFVKQRRFLAGLLLLLCLTGCTAAPTQTADGAP